MRELPWPTLPFALIAGRPARRGTAAVAEAPLTSAAPLVAAEVVEAAEAALSVAWARDEDEVREAQPRLRTALTALEHCYILMRTLCREIFDRTFYLPAELEREAYGPEARVALADALECAAEAMNGVAQVAAGTGPVGEARAAVLEDLAVNAAAASGARQARPA